LFGFKAYTPSFVNELIPHMRKSGFLLIMHYTKAPKAEMFIFGVKRTHTSFRSWKITHHT
jgi:hypothetical protein